MLHAGEESHTASTIVVRGLMLGLPVAYLVQGIAIFDVFPMYISLFLFSALAVHYFSSFNHHHE